MIPDYNINLFKILFDVEYPSQTLADYDSDIFDGMFFKRLNY